MYINSFRFKENGGACGRSSKKELLGILLLSFVLYSKKEKLERKKERR